jgi:hypothetical protein
MMVQIADRPILAVRNNTPQADYRSPTVLMTERNG